MPLVLAIDEGTTGVRAMVFDERSVQRGAAYEEISAAYPRPGWVEQDPLHIWAATQRVIGDALRAANAKASDLAAVGIAVQRATTVVWERATGLPIYPAISWQDARTAASASPSCWHKASSPTRWPRRPSSSGSCANAARWRAPPPASCASAPSTAGWCGS